MKCKWVNKYWLIDYLRFIIIKLYIKKYFIL
ncbi:hypothetical protein Goshw_003452 [Gossypium schwendimanii]|uniref:Uncharacterized protein n=1 Tax=Gossypium schwendimanii TaxID=34291 RepID=A0A7J9NF68_GOSSC|nr:hypothetical protein [Gossypium schwendimanii]